MLENGRNPIALYHVELMRYYMYVCGGGLMTHETGEVAPLGSIERPICINTPAPSWWAGGRSLLRRAGFVFQPRHHDESLGNLTLGWLTGQVLNWLSNCQGENGPTICVREVSTCFRQIYFGSANYRLQINSYFLSIPFHGNTFTQKLTWLLEIF